MSTLYQLQSEEDAVLASALLRRAGFRAETQERRGLGWTVTLLHQGGTQPEDAAGIVEGIDPLAFGAALPYG